MMHGQKNIKFLYYDARSEKHQISSALVWCDGRLLAEPSELYLNIQFQFVENIRRLLYKDLSFNISASSECTLFERIKRHA